jgi:multiple sugar transport system ATP-binding protein
MAAVELREIRKWYGTVEALAGVDAVAGDGELVVLLGPSGCGKSTLLRAIAGLEDIDGGEILIGGRPVSALPPAKRDIAMVFQDYALYPHMTVEENLSFGLRMRKTPPGEIRERVLGTAAMLGLEELLRRKPAELSGGQRQRVAIGRAIVRRPSVYLFDEPLSNLDARLRNQMRVEIKALQRRLGVTSIYVTHDQAEAMTLADRVVLLDRGRVVQAGAPLELYDRPANRFAGSFIGSPPMNFIEGDVRGGEFRFAGGSFAAAAPGKGPLTLGVRPEGLRLGGGDFEADVLVVEPLGFETQVVARAGADELVLRLPPGAMPSGRVGVGVDRAAIRWFDPASGNATG